MIDQRIRELTLDRYVTKDDLSIAIRDAEQRASTNAATILNTGLAQFEIKFNSAVEGVSRTMREGLNELNAWKNGVESQVTSRDETVRRLVDDQTQMERDIKSMSEVLTKTRGRVRSLHVAIHGDPSVKEGQPSLFETVVSLKEEVERSNNLQTQEIDQQAVLIAQHSTWIKQREDELARQKALWERRKKLALNCAGWFLKTRLGQVIVISLIVLAYYVFAPELAAALQKLLLP